MHRGTSSGTGTGVTHRDVATRRPSSTVKEGEGLFVIAIQGHHASPEGRTFGRGGILSPYLAAVKHAFLQFPVLSA